MLGSVVGQSVQYNPNFLPADNGTDFGGAGYGVPSTHMDGTSYPFTTTVYGSGNAPALEFTVTDKNTPQYVQGGQGGPGAIIIEYSLIDI
jgi:hypothetical protein